MLLALAPVLLSLWSWPPFPNSQLESLAPRPPDGYWFADCPSAFPCATPTYDYDRNCTVDLNDFAFYQVTKVRWDKWTVRYYWTRIVRDESSKLARFLDCMAPIKCNGMWFGGGPWVNRCRRVARVEWSVGYGDLP